MVMIEIILKGRMGIRPASLQVETFVISVTVVTAVLDDPPKSEMTGIGCVKGEKGVMSDRD